MCGITAIVATHRIQQSVLDHEHRQLLALKLESSLSNIYHRGPESCGIWMSDDNRVGKNPLSSLSFDKSSINTSVT